MNDNPVFQYFVYYFVFSVYPSKIMNELLKLPF